MKITVFAPANNVHTQKWLDYYNKKGYDVLNISFSSHRDEQDRSKWPNVRTVYLDVKFANKLAYFLTVPALKRILAKEQPDIFHSHYVSSYGLIGALANYHPYIVSVWGMDIYDFPKEGKINAELVKYALKKADVICSTSEVMKIETSQYTDKDIEVTPFGVDMERFKPMHEQRDSGRFIFGIVKTMTEKYGIRYLLEGYARFKEMVDPEQYAKTHLKIVGGGPLLEEYKQLAVRLGISDQTTFTGRIVHDDVPKAINEMDVFFVPSTLDSESFGVAAVEAMACEVPVVVANVGGLPEVVKDGETGYVIPTKDPQAIAEKMKFFFENPDIGKEMGKKGRTHVMEHYRWEENAERMTAIYERVLQERKGMSA
jgi:L-malate glycosyltransferase